MKVTMYKLPLYKVKSEQCSQDAQLKLL